MTDNPRISGIDWQGLQKGDLVPHDQVKEFFHSIFPDKEWNELYKKSEETFVEETESLKQTAAGAGLTDND